MFALVNLLRCYSLNKRVIKARNDGGASAGPSARSTGEKVDEYRVKRLS